ncbi:hypothetical protein NN561_013059 [Cricetulus griseus]
MGVASIWSGPFELSRLSEPKHSVPGFPLRAPLCASLSLSLVKVGTDDVLSIERRSPWHLCTSYPYSCRLFFLWTCANASSSSIPCLAPDAVIWGLPPGHARPPLRIPGSLPAFAHPPFSVPPGLCMLSTRNSMSRDLCKSSTRNFESFTFFVYSPGGRHPLGPDSIQEGVLGAYQAEMPRLATMLPGDSYHPAPLARLRSVGRLSDINPT